MATPHDPSGLYKTDNLQVQASQVVLVYTEWNEAIVGPLMDGARRIFSAFPQVEVKAIQVPGAVELSYAVAAHARVAPADAYIAFGCVIRGETPHFDYVCQSVTQGLTALNITLASPVIFGVLTVNTLEQAEERIGGRHGHKGEEAAMAALKMIALSQSLSTTQPRNP